MSKHFGKIWLILVVVVAILTENIDGDVVEKVFYDSSDIRESAATTTPTGMIGVISLFHMFRFEAMSEHRTGMMAIF